MIRLRIPLLIALLLLVLSGCRSQESNVPLNTPERSRQDPSPTVVLPTGTPEPEAVHTSTLETPAATVETPAAPSHSHTARTPHAATAEASVSHEHLEEGPHLRLASSPAPSDEDVARAEEIVQAAAASLARFADYKVALEEGYEIFAPQVPQDVYHFINYGDMLQDPYRYAPDRPAALLYRKVPGGYEWAGVMYAAPWGASEEELDRRFPLSMGQWHAHVNICLPAEREDWNRLAGDPLFGLEGSIDEPAECRAQGGTFLPSLFGWMVHVEIPETG